MIFAILEPRNAAACRAFSHVFDAIDESPSEYEHHAGFMDRRSDRVSLEDVVGGATGVDDTSSSYAATETSFASDTTDVAGDDHTASSELVWTGQYEFSLHKLPQISKVGWRAGYGRKWNEDPSGRTDLLLATFQDARQYGVHGNHLVLNFRPESGMFSVRGIHDDHKARVNNTVMQKSTGFLTLLNRSQSVHVGQLEYELRYLVEPDQDAAFQAAKSKYMTDMLGMAPPNPHTLATPSRTDVTIGDWKLLKAAGSGAEAVIKAAVGPRGDLVAVRTLYGGGKTKSRSETVSRWQHLTLMLRTVEHGDRVLQVKEIIPEEPRDPLQDIHVLLTPLARGDVLSMVLLHAGDRVPTAARQEILAQASAGVLALHESGYLHRDVKPENIGVLSLAPVSIVLLDLGQVHYLGYRGSTPCTPGHSGTVGYLSPEREVLDGQYGFPSDVWALGCVGFDLLYGHRRWAAGMNPWRDRDTFAAGRPVNTAGRPVDTAAIKRQLELFENAHARLAEEDSMSAAGLLAQMLKEDPEVRIDIATAIRHPAIALWLATSDAKFSERKRTADT